MIRFRSWLWSGALAAALLPAGAGAAADPALAKLEQQVAILAARIQELEGALATERAAASNTAVSAPPVADLDQKVRAIERRLEVQAEEAAASRVKTPLVALSDKGLAVTTPDGNFEMRLRGYVQGDYRQWIGDNADDDVDTLLLRRVRPIIEGTVYKQFYYRLMPDFAGSSVTLQDGYAEWRQYSFARVALGKFKPPVGLERLASGSELEFNERGLTNNLVPNRDFGLQLSGEAIGGQVTYALGAFNGVQDLGVAGASDSNDDKDFTGRVFVFPFKEWYGPLQGLGIGIAGSYGKEEYSLSSNAVTPNLASYVTPGQARFFRYRTTLASADVTVPGGGVVSVPRVTLLANSTVADGTRSRISPQAYWYWRQFGVLADYVESSQQVAFGAHREDLTHSAWQVTGAWVLTGEDASYRGVRPRVFFDPLAGTWGALELVARYGEFNVDNDSFDGVSATGAGTAFADPRQSATHATSWGLGLNWYLNRNLKLSFDYEHTWFNGGGGGSTLAPLDRETERVLLSRVQIAY